MALPVDADVLRLDRDAPLALELHRVEVLLAHLAGVDGAGDLEDAVRQRRLAMIDVGDDREVADPLEVHGRSHGILVRLIHVRRNRPVANIKSQKKRNITNAKRAERNKAAKSELKTRVKTATTSIGTDTNDEDVRLAVKRLDMAAAKGIIHPNQAARRKSRLMKKVSAST